MVFDHIFFEVYKAMVLIYSVGLPNGKLLEFARQSELSLLTLSPPPLSLSLSLFTSLKS